MFVACFDARVSCRAYRGVGVKDTRRARACVTTRSEKNKKRQTHLNDSSVDGGAEVLEVAAGAGAGKILLLRRPDGGGARGADDTHGADGHSHFCMCVKSVCVEGGKVRVCGKSDCSRSHRERRKATFDGDEKKKLHHLHGLHGLHTDRLNLWTWTRQKGDRNAHKKTFLPPRTFHGLCLLPFCTFFSLFTRHHASCKKQKHPFPQPPATCI